MKVAIIITSKNEDMMPACLDECRRQIDALATEDKYSFSIFTNHKGEAGIQSAWAQAVKDNCDSGLFMNSDLSLVGNAIATFLENSEFLKHKAIIAGSVSRDGSLVSGGRTRRGKLIEPDPVIPVPCRLYDMELVFIPQYAFSAVESPSDILSCSFWDYGYGRKARKAGVARVVAPSVLAKYEGDMVIPAWKNAEIGIWKRMFLLIGRGFRKIIMAVKASL